MSRTRLLSVSAAGLYLSGMTATAQPTASPVIDRQQPVDQIVVTAARTPVAQRKTGSAITVITREDIENRQSRYLTDLLRSVPGFSVSQSGGIGTQTQVRVRGGEGNHVLVLVDGVRANDPATDDEFRWEHFSTANIERIEIVRGPQSALWGSDAVSAVVNIITQQDPTSSSYNGYVEGGSDSTLNVGASAIVAYDAWTLTGGFESLETDGSNIARTGSEKDGAALDSASLGAKLTTRSGMSMQASVRASDATSHFDADDFFITGLPIDGDVATESDSVLAQLSTSFATGDGRFSWQLRSSRYESEHHNFVASTEDASTASDRTGLGLQTDIDLGRNSLSLALERENTDFSQRGPTDFGDPNQEQSSDVTSSIAEFQSFAGDRLSWSVGARHDSYSDFESAVTGKLSLAYRFSDLMRLRASVGTGQKAPTFIERYGYFPAQFLGNPDLEPETSLSYEIGTDRDFANGAVSLSATAYWQELSNEIDGFVFDTTSFMYTAANLAEDSERKGLETAVVWHLSDDIRLGANHTYTDATEPDAGSGQIRELRRPRHSGNFSIDFGSPARRFGINLAADYGGTREDMFFPPFPAPAQQLELADHWIVDIAAHYKINSRMTLFARSANLLDESYEQVYGYATPGRTMLVGLRTTLDR